MKVKAFILIGIVLAAAFFGIYDFGLAESKALDAKLPSNSSGKIGVIKVKNIFTNCNRNVKYKQEAIAEQEQFVAEMNKLQKEIEAEEAGLKMIKADSADYMKMVKSVLDKRGQYEAKKQYYQQMISAKDRSWTEKLYTDIIRVTEEVAKAKGLVMVFSEDEIDLSNAPGEEFMLRIRMHKLVYSGGCEDITDAVLAKLDAQ